MGWERKKKLIIEDEEDNEDRDRDGWGTVCVCVYRPMPNGIDHSVSQKSTEEIATMAHWIGFAETK